jgi:hypothetical protein
VCVYRITPLFSAGPLFMCQKEQLWLRNRVWSHATGTVLRLWPCKKLLIDMSLQSCCTLASPGPIIVKDFSMVSGISLLPLNITLWSPNIALTYQYCHVVKQISSSTHLFTTQHLINFSKSWHSKSLECQFFLPWHNNLEYSAVCRQ